MTPVARTDGSINRVAAAVVAVAAAAWGISGMPLRAVAEAGVSAGWVTVLFQLAPLLMLTPVALWRWRSLRAGGGALLLTGLLAGGAFSLYATSLVLTEVVRALMLFYITPVWSTLLERWLLGIPVRGVRLLTIVLGLAGLAVILGGDGGLPLPRGIGDWCGLVAGMVWALAAVRVRASEHLHPLDVTMSFFLGASVAAIACLALLPAAAASPPTAALLAEVAPWLGVFLLLVVIPGSYAILWGAARLSPGLVGILFMTEISVGTITAGLFAGEPFGLRELLGVLLVTSAALLEVFWPPSATAAPAPR